MQHFNLDNYVVDVLMPDLVGHDRRPATFIVYLYFLRHAARGKRDTLSVSLQTIATKTGLEWRDGKVYRNATRARIMQEIEDSLRRLRTDYIDIYQVHWPDPLVPVEETAEAFATFIE